jgi:tetratricopeptide (TPR) repeat protein
MNPGRNDPCPCGSGKKYKKCCLPREEAERSRAPRREAAPPFITEMRPDLDDAVDHALQRLERGERKQAEAEITELLETHPDYHLTNYAMGVYLAMAANQPAAAIPFFEKAVAIFPPFAEAHFNLGQSARATLNLTKALEAYRAAERYAQDEEMAGRARKELQMMENAVLKSTSFRSLDAFLANARLFDQAFECLMRKQHAQAVELFQRVLSDNPNHVQSHGNLALAYAGLGRRADALTSFDRALELDPNYEPAIQNRRVTVNMREGVPFIPDAVKEVEFYGDRFRAEQRAGGPDASSA